MERLRGVLVEVYDLMVAGGDTRHLAGVRHALGIIDDQGIGDIQRREELKRFLRSFLSGGAGSLRDVVFGSQAGQSLENPDALNDRFLSCLTELDSWVEGAS